MSKPQIRTHFTLGIIGAPFGIKGFVKVKPLSGETGHFSHLKEITVIKDSKEQIRELAEVVTHGDTLLIRFAGVEDPETAALLKGAELVAGREFAAPLKKGEFYIEDLKGLNVIDAKGEILGQIVNIVEGGGGFLAEIQLASGQTKLAPFRKEFFGEIDFAFGKVELLEFWILD